MNKEAEAKKLEDEKKAHQKKLHTVVNAVSKDEKSVVALNTKVDLLDSQIKDGSASEDQI